MPLKQWFIVWGGGGAGVISGFTGFGGGFCDSNPNLVNFLFLLLRFEATLLLLPCGSEL